MHWFIRFTGMLLAAQALGVWAREPEANADRWLTNAAVFPESFTHAVRSNAFAGLRVEAIAGQLQVTCPAHVGLAEPRIVSSADAPGHWPARDWRGRSMVLRGANWIGELPVESLDVPIIYFATASANGDQIVSPMRIAEPRALGLERPTRLFWAFLEGFEQGLDSWRVSDPTGLRTDVIAKDGRASLLVSIPAGRRSVTLQTTRLRGWFLEEHGAVGVGLWLRVKQGRGKAGFTLLANAFSTNQVAWRGPETVNLSTNWTKAVLRFDSFPNLSRGEIDLFAIELSAEPGTDFLLDNFHLAGRWRDDF